MQEFKLKIGGIEYDVTSTQSGNKTQNWHVRADWQSINIGWTIPIDTKFTMNQIMSFIATFHKAFYETLRNEHVDLVQR